MKKCIAFAAMIAVLALGADAQAKAKEKANKTKCSNRLDNIGSSGMDGVAQPARALIPTILRLRAMGDDETARHLTEVGVRQTRHRGHVTVLKLQETVDQCVAKMERAGDSPEDIRYIQLLGRKWILTLKAATDRNVDSFFDVWTEVS